MAGCATSPATPPPLRVPFAGIIRPHAAPIALAMEDADYPRGEPIALGPVEIGSAAAFTEFTYDAQRIGSRRDGGYRYRYSWQQILSVP